MWVNLVCKGSDPVLTRWGISGLIWVGFNSSSGYVGISGLVCRGSDRVLGISDLVWFGLSSLAGCLGISAMVGVQIVC